VSLVAGTNTLTFSMTQSGTSCINGQPTGPQLWVGDVNGDNVINSDDYSIILAHFGQSVPSGYADLDGNAAFDGVDYNMWLRSICYFGGGTGAVVGDGGRSDTPINQTLVLHAPSHHRVYPYTSDPGTMSLSPASGNYRVNQSFSVNVQANSAGTPLDGADMVVHYDPTVLKVSSLTAGSVFASTLALTNNPTVGEINISSVANQGQPVSVSGTLATIQFQVIGSGQTLVTLDFNPSSNAHSNMSQDGTAGQVLGSVFNASFTAGMLFVPQNYPTIAQALAAANSGETVLVAPGTYPELLTVPAGVTLKGQNAATTIIDGSSTNNTAVVYLGSGATISNLTIQHSGTGFWDAAVWADQGPVTVTNMRILNSSMGIVRFCWSPPCNDTSVITNNLVAHNSTTGILIHGAQAQVRYNTVDNNQLQGITFEAAGGQGDSTANILTSNATGLTAPTPTTLVKNLLWQNGTTYGSGTTPGATDILANPLFVKPGANNYKLHAVSAAVDADGSLGAYPFNATGKTPTQLTETQNGQQVTLSWHGTAAGGYYIFVARGASFFNRVVDAKKATTYTFSSLPAGSIEFAVVSYNGQRQESLAIYLTVTVTGATAPPVSTPTPVHQPTPSSTPTPCPIGANHRRSC
jgi:Cohesin domain/Right handed beta helix region